MKLNGILNSSISKALSDLGHTDKIAIGDCGLPIPLEKKIDISLKIGFPSFEDVLKEILKDLSVEKYIVAKEIMDYNPAQLEIIRHLLPHAEEEMMTHENFKNSLKNVNSIIRTGEASPFSNIILQSKNIF